MNNTSKSSQIKEDDLEDVNLGHQYDPKLVHINVGLEAAFKKKLADLLMEFSVSFLWHPL